MIAAAPPPPPPAIAQPAPYQLSYGIVTGTAAPGARRVIVRAGPRTLADLPLRGRRFYVRVKLPVAETPVRVITVGRAGRRSSSTVPHVFGAPNRARPQLRAPRNDPRLAATIRRLAQAFDGTCAIYVQDLRSGAGAAWNARATFPGASTLKLAIAVTALAREERTPALGSPLDRLLRKMLTYSDDQAANDTETYFGGSTTAGSALVNAMMRSLGLVDTEMYGGYLISPIGAGTRAPAGRIPLTVDSQPGWGRGKKTTAYDLAELLRFVWLASAGRGPLRTAQPGFTPSDARYLLYLLARVRDPGKLDREIGRLEGVHVLHKAGWIIHARHDNGIVLWPGGAIVVTVMTYRGSGAGSSSDVLAGRVAAAALRHFRG